jgi:hypothetical protein
MGCFAIVTIFWYGLPIYSKQFEALNARDPNLSIACLPQLIISYNQNILTYLEGDCTNFLD